MDLVAYYFSLKSAYGNGEQKLTARRGAYIRMIKDIPFIVLVG